MKLANVEQKNYDGVNPVKALNNIKRRYQERKRKVESDLKTALVLQGGGMRGIFGAGVCCALQELGYSEGFDEFYGVSAGALNGAYFLSGQAPYGATIYYQNINNKHFINFFRFKKIVDIDFLMNIIVKVKPLNTKRLLSSSTVFNIMLTEVSSGKAVIFRKGNFKNTDLLKILEATAAMPLAYDIPINIQGVDYLDGGVSCPIPIKEAIDNGCTDILVVLTRPKSYKPVSSRGILNRCFIKPMMQRHSKNFYAVYINRDRIHREQLQIIMGNKKYKKKKVNIITVFPEESLKIKRTTKNRKILKEAVNQGTAKIFQLFNPNSAI